MKLDAEDLRDLRPLIDAIVQSTVATLQADDAKLGDGGRLGFSEPEAASLLGIARHRLRDARLRGEIKARLVGKSYLYSRQSLVGFLRGLE